MRKYLKTAMILSILICSNVIVNGVIFLAPPGVAETPRSDKSIDSSLRVESPGQVNDFMIAIMGADYIAKYLREDLLPRLQRLPGKESFVRYAGVIEEYLADDYVQQVLEVDDMKKVIRKINYTKKMFELAEAEDSGKMIIVENDIRILTDLLSVLSCRYEPFDQLKKRITERLNTIISVLEAKRKAGGIKSVVDQERFVKNIQEFNLAFLDERAGIYPGTVFVLEAVRRNLGSILNELNEELLRDFAANIMFDSMIGFSFPVSDAALKGLALLKKEDVYIDTEIDSVILDSVMFFGYYYPESLNMLIGNELNKKVFEVIYDNRENEQIFNDIYFILGNIIADRGVAADFSEWLKSSEHANTGLTKERIFKREVAYFVELAESAGRRILEPQRLFGGLWGDVFGWAHSRRMFMLQLILKDFSRYQTEKLISARSNPPVTPPKKNNDI